MVRLGESRSLGGAGLTETAADALYVNITGDTMTGKLIGTTGSFTGTLAATEGSFTTGTFYSGQVIDDWIVTNNIGCTDITASGTVKGATGSITGSLIVNEGTFVTGTFTAAKCSTTPSVDNDLANKAYVDSAGSNVPNWNLLIDDAISASAAYSSGSFTVYDVIMVKMNIVTSDTARIGLQLNEDTGNNYYYTEVQNGPALATISAGGSLSIYKNPGGVSYNTPTTIFIPGRRIASEGEISLSMIAGGVTWSANGAVTISGEYMAMPAAGISSLTITPSAGTITGDIKIYGLDY